MSTTKDYQPTQAERDALKNAVWGKDEHHPKFLSEAGVAAQEGNEAQWIFGSVAAGVIVTGLTGFPPLGIAIAAIGVWKAQKTIQDDQKRFKLIVENGCVAPFLDNEKLKDYAGKFGAEEVIRQCAFAEAKTPGISSRPAKMLLDDLKPDLLDKLRDNKTPPAEVFFAPGNSEFMQRQAADLEKLAPGFGLGAISQSQTAKGQVLNSSSPQWLDLNTLNKASDPIQAPSDPTLKTLDALFHFFRLQATLVWGGQGSGKTSAVRAIVVDKVKHNQKIVVLNPHGSKATWQGVTLIGSGKNYKSVERFLEVYLAQIKKRYQEFDESGLSEDDYLHQLIAAGSVTSIICEEVASWAVSIDPGLLNQFMKAGLTEARKVGLPIVIVSHDPSLSFINLKEGARLRDSGMVIVELEPGIPDEVTGETKSTGKGKLQIPGQKGAISFTFSKPAPFIALDPAPPASPGSPTQTGEPSQDPAPIKSKPKDDTSDAQASQRGFFRKLGDGLQNMLGVNDPYEPIHSSGDFQGYAATEYEAVRESPQSIDFEVENVRTELRPIVEYSIKQKGLIKAIDVKRNVKEFKSVSTEEIRNHFIGLVNMGCGASQGDGDFLKYSAFGSVMGCDAITG